MDQQTEERDRLARDRKDIIDRLRRPMPNAVRDGMKFYLENIEAEIDSL